MKKHRNEMAQLMVRLEIALISGASVYNHVAHSRKHLPETCGGYP